MRTPIAGAAPLTWDAVDANLSNQTGIVTKALVDVQRLMVCAILANPKSPVESMPNQVKTQVKSVVTTNSSARMTLIFKSNAVLRTFRGSCFTLYLNYVFAFPANISYHTDHTQL